MNYDFQPKAVRSVRRHWRNGHHKVLLVGPTGCGKTNMLQAILGGERALVVAHTREIVTQTADRFRRVFGRSEVGVILAGTHGRPQARIQVASVQTILARVGREGFRLPDIDILAIDEAHHYPADLWSTLLPLFPGVLVVGATATPERGDGRPLADIFDKLTVAAHCSDLVDRKVLVPCRLIRPSESLGSDLAQDPVEAWDRWSEGAPTFAFCRGIADADALAARFRHYGVKAAAYHERINRGERALVLSRFTSGDLDVVCSVNALTEGVNIPSAQCALLTRSFGTEGGYVQTVGRILRGDSPGKRDATLIDLTGTSHVWGKPTEDRDYTMWGQPRGDGEPGKGGGGGGEVDPGEVVDAELEMVDRGALRRGEDVAPLGRVAARKQSRTFKADRKRPGKAALQYFEDHGQWPAIA